MGQVGHSAGSNSVAGGATGLRFTAEPTISVPPSDVVGEGQRLHPVKQCFVNAGVDQGGAAYPVSSFAFCPSAGRVSRFDQRIGPA